MSVKFAEHDRLRKRYLPLCATLAPADLWTLQLLSVVYVPVSQDDLARCIGRCGRSAIDLSKILSRLLKTGLIERDGDGLRCLPALREPLTRQTVEGGSFQTLAGGVREALWRGAGWSEREVRSYEQGVARLRVSLYQRNYRDTQEILRHCANLFPTESEQENPFILIGCDPFDKDWLSTFPPRMLLEILLAILNYSLRTLDEAEEAFTMLRDCCEKNPDSPAWLYLVPHWLYRGKLAKARKALKNVGKDTAAGSVLSLQGWLETVSGDTAKAMELFQNAAREERTLPSLLNLFYVLTLLKHGQDEEAALLIRQEDRKERNPYLPGFAVLGWLRLRRENVCSEPAPCPDDNALPLAKLLYYLVLFWEDARELQRRRCEVAEFYEDCARGGYDWFAAEAAELLARTEGASESDWAGRLAVIRKRVNAAPLCELFAPKAGWERPLEALSQVPQMVEAQRDQSHNIRLAWLVSFNEPTGIYELLPVEQHRTSDGGWGKGRRLSLQRLFDEKHDLAYLDRQDLELCNTIAPVSYGTGRGAQMGYEIDYAKALPALAGHPRVFWSDAPEVRVEITSGEPELLAVREGPQLHIRLEPRIDEDSPVTLKREGPTRLRVVMVTPAHRLIATIIGTDGIRLPEAAFARAGEIIERLSHLVSVQSDVGMTNALAEEVAVDGRLRVHLMPAGNGLKMEMLVQPFGAQGGYYRPGVGAQTLLAEVGGKRLRTTRSLSQELATADEVVRACPSLRQGAENDGIWTLEDAIDCLELLLELNALEDKVVIEWPQGGRLNVRGQAGLSALGVRVRAENDWFTLEGSLQVSEDLVLDMRRLLEMSRHARGRFIPIGKDTYIALTDSFRKRLEELRDFGDTDGDGTRFHPLAALALEDLAGEAGSFTADLEWKKLIGRLHAHSDRALPPTLQAELREYQLEGYRWMSRLADWGMGACLADDMGLGKTVQTLALLLDRAPKGPTLVVAPTSVCFNWITEAQRFAPSLRVTLFGGSDRKAMVDALGPFSVLVCSYAMLQQEAELLCARRWHTVVLDEAQAIKNAATKRSKAAMSLQSDFRLVTTGTPLENHLGELWNLFQFLNPGLLGSLRRFNLRFAVPIEKDRDESARARLKKLLAPFILRRLKTQVLDELPPRTEIVKHIEMSQHEIAFYEALRREAVTRLEGDRDAPAGERRLQILAQIMRLRRACCNPKLIDPATMVDSSKMEEFLEIVDELLENNHKALVFSQFVDHLDLLRKQLDARGIHYQYLDGSTPAGKRKKLVEAFQSGEGDLFLISLKAGGQGLNLTAADYVLHMDPWWNPAVEDQASDRAYRIGQTRPVTIYRMVARGTIEEKIVELHKKKRSLAESLLEGNDMGGQMTAEDLLGLIRDV